MKIDSITYTNKKRQSQLLRQPLSHYIHQLLVKTQAAATNTMQTIRSFINRTNLYNPEENQNLYAKACVSTSFYHCTYTLMRTITRAGSLKKNADDIDLIYS
jgi:hypothetical protein